MAGHPGPPTTRGTETLLRIYDALVAVLPGAGPSICALSMEKR